MSLPVALESVQTRFKSAQSYKDIFGDLPKGDEATQVAHLKAQFRFLAKVVHPDQQEPQYRDQAHTLFAELNRLHTNAMTALKEGRYGKPFGKRVSSADSGGTFDLTSSLGTYRLSNVACAKGDFSVLYRGTRVGADSGAIVAKVASAVVYSCVCAQNVVVVIRIFHHAIQATIFEGLCRRLWHKI